MVLSNPTDIRLPPVKIGDDVPPSARGVMRSLADLVSQCTAIQPDARPSFAEILEACTQTAILIPSLTSKLQLTIVDTDHNNPRPNPDLNPDPDPDHGSLPCSQPLALDTV